MQEIPSLPENFSSDNQCWVWYSGSCSLANLSRLIGLGCRDPVQQPEKQSIPSDLGVIPIVEVQRASQNLKDINWKDYYIPVLMALTWKIMILQENNPWKH